MRLPVGALLLVSLASAQTILIRGGMVYDGTGRSPYRADIRVKGSEIQAIGKLNPLRGEKVLKANGLAVAPGFIDAHSHADSGIKQFPSAESQVRQGITTSIVGQDGIWDRPVKEHLLAIQAVKPAINFAAFSGEGGIREKVLGKDFERPATADEIRKMEDLVRADMQAGALGLSTGLEYNPGYYSSREELVSLAKVAAQFGGMYISHVRDETNGEIGAFEELVAIAREAQLPAQISHIKLAVASMWGKYPEIRKLLQAADQERLQITSDVYPYLYWQSTITVLTNSRDWGNKKVWEDGLRDVGGAANVRLTRYSPDATWEGKTLAELSTKTGLDPAALIMHIIEKTKDGKGREGIVCTAMREEDLRHFLANPRIMFCTDGEIKGSHPRGAGSFPRILGRYVREQRVIPLAEAIRKGTSLPAGRFGLTDRGVIRPGMKADIVVFDPKRIIDKATPEKPQAYSVGMIHVLVNGVPVLANEKMTGARGGRALFKVVKPQRVEQSAH